MTARDVCYTSVDIVSFDSGVNVACMVGPTVVFDRDRKSYGLHGWAVGINGTVSLP